MQPGNAPSSNDTRESMEAGVDKAREPRVRILNENLQLICIGRLVLSRKRPHYLTLVLSLFFSMKNEELAAIIQALEASLHKHTEEQFTKVSEKLDEQVARLDVRVDQLQFSASKPQGEVGNSSHATESVTIHRSNSNTKTCEVNSIFKVMRVKVPRFEGAGVEEWIYKMNKFFDLHNVDPSLRLAMVAFHLEGAPPTWYQWMEKGPGFVDWELFLRALRLRFVISIYDDPLGKIAKLVQTGRVSTFREEFEQLMTQISDAMAKAQLYEDRQDDILTRARGDGYRPHWPPRVTPSFSLTALKQWPKRSV
ncbi:hypothetical protein G4B88_025233 [Cannabis sativa]|uniref:Retrotransposon gag domain-containing protein n=1 Tax=Cannabis sativa TaxID=3483 RepID=A0A7J6EA23_CANSA|nr:hypothetical protein G4B88_025233 [Cannabis sativa]